MSEHVARLAAQEATLFDEWRSSLRGPIIVYGAGGLGRKLVRGLHAEGIPVAGFSDTNAALWGSTVEGLPVLSPDSAVAAAGPHGGFVITTWSLGVESRNAEIHQNLLARGANHTIFFTAAFYRYPNRFLPHYRVDLPSKLWAARSQVLEAAQLVLDRDSQKEFATQLRMLVTETFDEPSYNTPGATYFPQDLVVPDARERFVDCGAFDGDTLASLVSVAGGKIAEYHGYEPDPANFQLLRRTTEALSAHITDRCTIRECAVGRRWETLTFAATGNVSARAASDGATLVESGPLDDLLADARPSFIKMDIEGAEPEAIAGGSGVIARSAPVMAVCVYHLQSHLWDIPLALSRLLPHATLALRAHKATFDVVCYAVPRYRLPPVRD
jgi:FkbM family methyltransferase